MWVRFEFPFDKTVVGYPPDIMRMAAFRQSSTLEAKSAVSGGDATLNLLEMSPLARSSSTALPIASGLFSRSAFRWNVPTRYC